MLAMRTSWRCEPNAIIICSPKLLQAGRMATQITRDDDECPFCQIANNQTDTEILTRDGELLCFRDAKPGAGHHYLVITATHIGDCKALRAQHIPTVERMAEMGRGALEKNKVRDLTDIRLGFHVPPFSSVPHLHLHALAPASKMNESSQRRYGPRSHWFITVSERRDVLAGGPSYDTLWLSFVLQVEEALTQLRTRGRIK
ncbi:adenosine 5'-monophosphoramidase HINT3-like isoform X2 [Phycodurus eques]|uniref:adenosine 5'-monophosphoramidase HINT3-like isoform X2 n=1 Tax=Phycodurus eques TaxID=693459 RepID=UPI002ACE1638|nr:adenosine 5'-monophosphoramidase HINT3-like isoform X2 [Phycodurus eques]